MIGYSSRPPSSSEALPRRRPALAAVEAALRPSTLVLGTVAILSLAAVTVPVSDASFWMHSRAGLWTLQHRWPPTRDLLTYTVPDHRWIDHEWLTQVLMRLVQDAAGLAGVAVAMGLLTWAGLLLCLAAARRGPDGTRPYVIVGLTMALAALAGLPVWGARPQMVTFFLLSLELLWLRRCAEGSSRAVWWLPAVMVAWSNLHGGWPAGFAFLGLAAASEALTWLAERTRREHLVRARRLAVVGLLGVLALAVNPNGLAIYAYPFQTMSSAAQQDLIAEWLSPDFHQASVHAFEAMLLLLILGLAFGRPRLHDVLFSVAAIALALQSARHIALFAAATAPVIAATWPDVWRRVSAGRGWNPGRRPPPAWTAAVTGLVLVLVAAASAVRVEGALDRQPDVTRRSVPVGAADWLAAHPGVGTRMFNEYAWGAYLGDRFFGQPNRRVFVFAEGVVIGDQLLLQYRQVAALQPGWRSALDRWGVDYVVFDRGSALDNVLATQPDWRRVYRDPTAVIYVRGPAAPPSIPP